MEKRPLANLFGQIALRERMTTPERLDECLAAQRQKPPGPGNRIGEVMYFRNYLKREDIRAVLQIQKKLDGAPVQKFGPYELVKRLGQGGMGTVYLAKHPGQDRMVALKVLPKQLAADFEFLERFRREARVVKALNHPNIVGCSEVGVHGGVHFIAMEYVDGQDLETTIEKKGRQPEASVLRVGRHMAAALSAANAQGIVHRDIKPANILVDGGGNAKLTDLGLSRASSSDTRLTMPGTTVGTPYYISPEQARGEEDIDTRSDIYSLGATLYHMATGQVMFGDKNGVVVMRKHISELPPPVRSLAPEISEPTAGLIERMLAKEREERPQTPQELLAEIEAIERGEAPPPRQGRSAAPSGDESGDSAGFADKCRSALRGAWNRIAGLFGRNSGSEDGQGGEKP